MVVSDFLRGYHILCDESGFVFVIGAMSQKFCSQNKQIQMTKAKDIGLGLVLFWILKIRILILFRISYFDIRISDLGDATLANHALRG